MIKSNTTNKKEICNIEPDVFNIFFFESVKEIKNKVYTPSFSRTFNEFMDKHLINNLVYFKWTTVTPNDVLSTVKAMSNSDSLDVYKMSNLLKCIILSVAEPLAVTINCLLHDGIFPEQLKITQLYPILKSGPKD